MFKWLHRYFTIRHHRAYVQAHICLKFVEYPRGVFRPYLQKPEDISLYTWSSKDPEVKAVICEDCRDSHGFTWRNVRWDELGDYFTAPSMEQLEDALSRVVLNVGRRDC